MRPAAAEARGPRGQARITKRGQRRGGDVARQGGVLLLCVGEGLVVPDLHHAVAGPIAVAVDHVGRGIVPRGGRDDRHVDGGDGGRVEPVDGDVARLGRVARRDGMPGAVVGPPDVEAGGVAVEVPRRQLVGHLGAGLLPDPGGEVGTPLLVEVLVAAVVDAGVPVGAELVAVGVGGVRLVAHLALGDGDDARRAGG